MLGVLSGVSPDDSGADALLERETGRDLPRLRLTPRHSAIIILILTMALALSMTLLVQQTIAMNRAMSSSGMASAGDSPGSAVTSSPLASTSASTSARPVAPTPTASAPSGGAQRTDGSSSLSGSSSPSASPSPSAASGGSAVPIDLNTATAEQLETINGVGPATARKILDHRARIGRYASVEELLDVPGIGDKTLSKIRPYVTVGAGGTAGGAVGAAEGGGS
ncbi:ComEA family DNA-binding protein [Bifidobacterium simiarum]|uniref:Competence protein ComEA n=1 Tax=Bifidobacterium simiarum TaxID=2045441 RepID=A0A2M9HHA5_9BIFI|nr:helix-hairpin-helix domain-containing protein [Bifidobacterium simiarum]PJM76202.1 competence protein ComEA [Bifidobacterium simiarum]